MAQNHVRLQRMVAHNANEVQSYMKDLNNWSEEMHSKEESEQNVAAALEHKERGNHFMKQKNYEEAIKSYTEGLQLDPKNAILYSNRAQAYLFLKQYEKTINDCTMALKLNSSAVNIKASFRRAKAYMELKQFDKAKEDLLYILKQDPKHAEAKQLLQQCGFKPPGKKIPDRPKPKIVSPVSEQIRTSPERIGAGDSEYPKIIKAINKPPHLRSKRVILPVPVKIKGAESTSKRSSVSSLPSSIASTPVSPLSPTDEQMVIDNTGIAQDIDKLSTIEVPPKPTTAAQFVTTWKTLKEYPAVCAQYLNQLQPEDYEIFQNSMDLPVLSEILTTLQWEFLPRKWPFTHHLQGLLRVRRLGTLFMLMTEKDRANARNLISLCDSEELKNYYQKNFIL